VRIGRDVVLEPMTFLTGDTVVADGAVIGPCSRIEDSSVGAGARVDSSVLRGVRVGPGAIVGPMGLLHSGTVLEARARTGAFVEVRNSTVGEGSKVIGDGSSVGSDTMLVAPVEIGSGATTAAGSAITRDVPDGALGIERSGQRTVEGWAEKRRATVDTKDTGSGTEA
jgi:bifunctional UDP-N-acetylglucosamine pyrophosphorylase/glucosamine-1-phosphate N-acetyltransferase